MFRCVTALWREGTHRVLGRSQADCECYAMPSLRECYAMPSLINCLSPSLPLSRSLPLSCVCARARSLTLSLALARARSLSGRIPDLVRAPIEHFPTAKHQHSAPFQFLAKRRSTSTSNRPPHITPPPRWLTAISMHLEDHHVGRHCHFVHLETQPPPHGCSLSIATPCACPHLSVTTCGPLLARKLRANCRQPYPHRTVVRGQSLAHRGRVHTHTHTHTHTHSFQL
jgi:hypothetical protein